MIKLIKNELTKIFHKKAIYIVVAVIFLFITTINVLSKVLENIDQFYEYNNDEEIAFLQQELKNLDKNKPEEKELYAAYKTQLDEALLNKKFESGSWQSYIVQTKGNEIISNMNYSEGKENFEDAKKEYDEFIKRLENNDWKAYVKEELESVNAQIKEIEESKKELTKEIDKLSAEMNLSTLKAQKQALEWRLEYDISYTKSNRNTFIEDWLNNKNTIDYTKQAEKNNEKITYSDRCQKQETEAEIALLEYAIKNVKNDDINSAYVNDTRILAGTNDTALINTWDEYSLFIFVAATMIAGAIVSEEFNKGTIKLLLVRPYKRTKLLISKFIASLIVLILVVIIVGLVGFIVVGIVNGFNKYNSQITIYNFGKSSVEQVSLLKYTVLTGISKMPMYILIMTLAFSLGVIFNNTPLAIALPLVGNMVSQIINALFLEFEKAKFLKFFFTPNWDFSIFLFGKMPRYEGLSIGFSTIICIIYFAIMIVMSIIVFKNKDIKNV